MQEHALNSSNDTIRTFGFEFWMKICIYENYNQNDISIPPACGRTQPRTAAQNSHESKVLIVSHSFGRFTPLIKIKIGRFEWVTRLWRQLPLKVSLLLILFESWSMCHSHFPIEITYRHTIPNVSPSNVECESTEIHHFINRIKYNFNFNYLFNLYRRISIQIQ